MRTAPAVTVDVTPDPIWRAGLLLIAGLTAVSLPMWWASQRADATGSDVGSQVGAALAGTVWLVAIRLTWRLRHPPCHTLRWTGQIWQTLDARRHATPVTLTVAIDAGGWMLLRARTVSTAAEAPAGPLACLLRIAAHATGRSSRWMALAEHRLPHTWHALRCAVHGQPITPESSAERGAQT